MPLCPIRFAAVAVLVALSAGSLPAGEYDAGVRSYRARDLISRGPVLAFARSSGGSFIVGSDRLSVFDGSRWARIEVPGVSEFRALAAAPASSDAKSTERVWVGAGNTIGFLDKDRYGRWQFTSLEPALRAQGQSAPERVIFAGALEEGVVFGGAHSFLRWIHGQARTWTAAGEAPLQFCSDDHAGTWIWEPGVGLLRLDRAGALTLLRNPALMPPGVVRWILPAPSGGVSDAGQDGLVGTDDGVFKLSESGYVRLGPLSAAVAGQESKAAIQVDARVIAVATRRGGVIYATRSGEVAAVLDRKTGFRDDAVYGLWRSPRGDDVWVGLEDGCVRANGIGYVRLLGPSEGMERGSPRKVLAINGTVQVITDQAVYRVAPESEGFLRVVPVGSGRRLRQLLPGPWVSGAGGMWGWDSAGRLSALGAGFDLGQGLRLTDRPVSALESPEGTLWVATHGGEILRYQAANVPSTESWRLIARYGRGGALTGLAGRLILSRLGTRTLLFTDKQTLQFDSAAGFVPATDLSGWAVAAAALTPDGGGREVYWVAQKLGVSDFLPLVVLRVVSKENGKTDVVPLRVPGLDALGEITSLDVVGSRGSEVLWIGGKGGLLRFETALALPLSPVPDARWVEVFCDRVGSLELVPTSQVALPATTRRIRFVFSAGQATELGETFYQTWLKSVEVDWSSPQPQNTREFTGLAAGTYTFCVRRLDRYGRVGPAVSYEFIILQPWYVRWPVWVTGGLLLSGMAITLLNWRVRRLHETAGRLNRLVTERTRELSLSNTAKSEFLESISHEIRNPLNGVIGLIGMLDEKGLDDRQRAHVISLKACAASLLHSFNAVLNFTKFEHGQVPLDEQAFNLTDLLDAIRALFAPAAENCGIELRTNYDESARGEFVGDETKIETVISNFVGNALKHSGGSRVEICAAVVSGRGSEAEILIEVADDGPGIPREEQPLIFKKFVRGSRARELRSSGAGIGLATCAALARTMGGNVGVESPSAWEGANDQGRGTAFFLRLILARQDPLRDALLPPSRGSAQPVALIVEDQEFNRVVLSDMIAELGYTPVTASNAEEAFAQMSEHRVEVVLVDSELPDMNGQEIARRLRRQAGPDLTIIGTSAHDDPAREAAGQQAGLNAVVTKPYSLAALRRAIARSPKSNPRAEPASGLEAFLRYARSTGETIDIAAARYRSILAAELTTIRTAHQEAAGAVLAGAAHRLASHAALVGAKELYSATGQLAGAARRNDRVAISQALASVETAAAALLVTLVSESQPAIPSVE